MAVVESAMEEVDNAMDDYADQVALEHIWFVHGKQASSVWLKLIDLRNWQKLDVILNILTICGSISVKFLFFLVPLWKLSTAWSATLPPAPVSGWPPNPGWSGGGPGGEDTATVTHFAKENGGSAGRALMSFEEVPGTGSMLFFVKAPKAVS